MNIASIDGKLFLFLKQVVVEESNDVCMLKNVLMLMKQKYSLNSVMKGKIFFLLIQLPARLTFGWFSLWPPFSLCSNFPENRRSQYTTLHFAFTSLICPFFSAKKGTKFCHSGWHSSASVWSRIMVNSEQLVSYYNDLEMT